MNPIDYSGAFAEQTPQVSLMQGFKDGAGMLALQQEQQQKQAALQQKQQQYQVIQSLISNPNAGGEEYAKATLLVPGMREQLKQAWDTKNQTQQQSHLADLSQWGAAIQNQRPELAIAAMNARADAMENTSGPTKESQALRAQAQVIKEYPKFGNFMIKSLLAAHPDGGKVVDNIAKLGVEQRTQDLHGDEVKKAKAEAVKAGVEARIAQRTEADVIAAPGIKNADITSQIEDRAARLGLDRDKLTSDVQLKIGELKQKAGTLSDNSAKFVNDSAMAAVTADQSANQALELANQFEQLGGGNGGFATTAEAWAKLTGNQNAITSARQEYTRIRNSAAIKSLPPGPATDKDIALALSGFPGNTADSKFIASFLRGMAKLQQREAVLETAKAEWVNSVGNLGKPKSDILVDGGNVPAGSSFVDFSRQFLKRKTDERAAVQSAEITKARGYMRFAQPQTPQQGGASGDY